MTVNAFKFLLSIHFSGSTQLYVVHNSVIASIKYKFCAISMKYYLNFLSWEILDEPHILY